MQFLKENFQLVCLLVGVVGVILSVITLAAEARKKRNYCIHLFPATLHSFAPSVMPPPGAAL